MPAPASRLSVAICGCAALLPRRYMPTGRRLDSPLVQQLFQMFSWTEAAVPTDLQHRNDLLAAAIDASHFDRKARRWRVQLPRLGGRGGCACWAAAARRHPAPARSHQAHPSARSSALPQKGLARRAFTWAPTKLAEAVGYLARVQGEEGAVAQLDREPIFCLQTGGPWGCTLAGWRAAQAGPSSRRWWRLPGEPSMPRAAACLPCSHLPAVLGAAGVPRRASPGPNIPQHRCALQGMAAAGHGCCTAGARELQGCFHAAAGTARERRCDPMALPAADAAARLYATDQWEKIHDPDSDTHAVVAWEHHAAPRCGRVQVSREESTERACGSPACGSPPAYAHRRGACRAHLVSHACAAGAQPPFRTWSLTPRRGTWSTSRRGAGTAAASSPCTPGFYAAWLATGFSEKVLARLREIRAAAGGPLHFWVTGGQRARGAVWRAPYGCWALLPCVLPRCCCA